MSEQYIETAALRELLQKNAEELDAIKKVAKQLLGAYRGTLNHSGAQIAANRYTNVLIAEAEDRLGILQ